MFLLTVCCGFILELLPAYLPLHGTETEKRTIVSVPSIKETV